MVSQAMVSAPMPSKLSQLRDDEDIPAEIQQMGATENLTSATFSIPRKTTIATDGKPHKVTIRIFQLEATFTYSVLPRLSQQAYLKASVKNSTSSYPFLPGKLNVFMDNNFVAKSDIPMVTPNESFGVHLGVDPGIKVEYRPVKKKREQSGMMFSKVNKMSVHYCTVLRNNKSDSVTITLFEQLPKSNNTTDVKVKLLEPEEVPELPPGSDNEEMPLLLTPANNVRFFFSLNAGERREVPFGYSFEWATDREIDESPFA